MSENNSTQNVGTNLGGVMTQAPPQSGDELIRQLSDTEYLMIKNKESFIIMNDGDYITFRYLYRNPVGEWVLTGAFFHENCNFEQLKKLVRIAFRKWKPLWEDSVLIVKDNFIVTNVSGVIQRAMMFCAVNDNVKKISDLPAIQAQAWAEELTYHDKEYYEKVKKALRILFN